MFVGILQLQLEIPGAVSLKDKRRVLKSLLERTRRTFEVAASEVADHDVWNRATIGVTCVSSERRHAQSRMQKVLNALDQESDAIVAGSRIEVI